MRYPTALFLLLVAALLEAGGDAILRAGLHTSFMTRRLLLFSGGGLILLAYGCLINAAPWSFGRLIGVYVVFFFLTAQVIAWLAFGQLPQRGVWLGGALIVLGGLVISAGRV